MEVPLIIDGRQAGTLCMAKSGLYTLLEANLDGCAKKLVRLWAHGGGRSAYLGVMQPWSGGLWLRRKLSRRELEEFPTPITYASDREHEDGEQREENNEGGYHNTEPKMETTLEQQGTDGLHNTETNLKTCPWPAEIPAGDLLWYARPDGTLVSHDGVSSLLALPEALHEAGAQAARREIEGKKYLVFRY